MSNDLRNWVHLLCQYGLEDDTFFQKFWKDLLQYEDIYKEVQYYAEHNEFLGETLICGYSIIDILVWQIDHFKSHMDRGEYDMQSNPERMILMAFRTFMNMKETPDSYVLAIQTETGTDYAEKY